MAEPVKLYLFKSLPAIECVKHLCAIHFNKTRFKANNTVVISLLQTDFKFLQGDFALKQERKKPLQRCNEALQGYFDLLQGYMKSLQG